MTTDDKWQFLYLLLEAELAAQVAPDQAIGDQQIDAPEHQLAKIGFVAWRRFTPKA
ncbi:hypothetical protein D3C73_1493320 [compost metagenome]